METFKVSTIDLDKTDTNKYNKMENGRNWK
jgi:hypothetical protein